VGPGVVRRAEEADVVRVQLRHVPDELDDLSMVPIPLG
jgi:hypothetical protein